MAASQAFLVVRKHSIPPPFSLVNFRIQHSHLRRAIAGAGDLVRGHSPGDPGQILRAERDLERAQGLAELRPGSSPDEGKNIHPARQHPRNRELSGCGPLLLRDSLR